MSKLTKALAWVFAAGSVAFFGGMVLLMPIMMAAFILPVWWQYVFMAVAVPTIVALPIWLVAGSILALRSALGEQPEVKS